MSGHSKWKTIQHKKGAADAKRGKIFSALSKELTITARHGGGDSATNASLRAVIQKARAANMPADNIDRAIKKGTGEIVGATLEEITYEGYAAGGVGLVVTTVTDNRNRTTAEIRHIFTKFNSSFATQGSVSRNFKRRGVIEVDAETAEEDKVLEIALESGAEDVETADGVYRILSPTDSFSDVVDALEAAEIKPSTAEITLVPEISVPIADKSVASTMLKFVSALEENDDVQGVYANYEIEDTILDELAEEQ